MAALDMSQFILPNETEVCALDCKTAFGGLSTKEKMYAHFLSKASYAGGLAVLFQTSPESPGLYLFLQRLFQIKPVETLKSMALESGASEEDFQALLIYASGVFSNMGNYKSFGDSKFVPNVPKEKLGALVNALGDSELNELWARVSEPMYTLGERQRQLGLGQKGTTTYFSANCDISDAEVAQKFLDSKDLSAYNSRLVKLADDKYEVRLASADETDSGFECCGDHCMEEDGKQLQFCVRRGDYSGLMALVAENLEKAVEHAANSDQQQMLLKYAESFRSGSIPAHKDGSRAWIRDKGPAVESYIGFIESYRDPYGVRGEFEGFVAVVNREMSAKFTRLVENAERFLPLLPWGAAYEKDRFLRPDFTSLDVLTFAGSGIPAGINIPNYNDIRQDEGFKNVSLGNVLSAGYKEAKITFLDEKDKELFKELKVAAFEVQVGLHELLGHGSGKLFIQNADGSFNFDAENTEHTETREKVSSWYLHTETWDSKFPVIGASYEECRAECVGLHLCVNKDVLEIFGYHDSSGDDIIYVNWLIMVRAGLMSLEFYSPETCKWRQAHMNARFVILRVLLEAGQGLVQLERRSGADGKPDVVVRLDRSKILSVGKPAIAAFLRKLQVYKSTGDYASGKAMYDHYSAVTNDAPNNFLELRHVVLTRKQPRKMFVQANTSLQGDEVVLASYDSCPEALIRSWQDRFPAGDATYAILRQLWERDAKLFY